MTWFPILPAVDAESPWIEMEVSEMILFGFVIIHNTAGFIQRCSALEFSLNFRIAAWALIVHVLAASNSPNIYIAWSACL